MKNLIIWISIIAYFFPLALCAESKQNITVFTVPSREDEKDTRYEYDYEVFKLALEKTKNKYGAYELNRLRKRANFKRFYKTAIENSEPNFFYKVSVSQDLIKKLGCIHFPVDLGIVGYRVAFVSKKIKEEVAKVRALDDLKKFSIVQGSGWLDVDILKHNGFKVDIGSSYVGLFRMVADQRSDLFTRGANEVYSEWMANANVENLDYDETFLLQYPLPRFFCGNKKNKVSFERVKEGLLIAYEDGSLQKIWRENYKRSIEFVKMYQRRIFKLDNPFLRGLDSSYENYFYRPDLDKMGVQGK